MAKNADILHTHTGSENDPHREPSHLIENEPMEGTPFRLVGNKDRGYFATWGKYRVTEVHETMAQARETILEMNWTEVMTCCMAVAMQVIEERLITAPGTTIKL